MGRKTLFPLVAHNTDVCGEGNEMLPAGCKELEEGLYFSPTSPLRLRSSLRCVCDSFIQL